MPEWCEGGRRRLIVSIVSVWETDRGRERSLMWNWKRHRLMYGRDASASPKKLSKLIQFWPYQQGMMAHAKNSLKWMHKRRISRRKKERECECVCQALIPSFFSSLVCIGKGRRAQTLCVDFYVYAWEKERERERERKALYSSVPVIHHLWKLGKYKLVSSQLPSPPPRRCAMFASLRGPDLWETKERAAAVAAVPRARLRRCM